MRAVRFSRFGGPEVLEVVDVPDPHPGPHEVRIRVGAAGINASDWRKRQGLMDEELPQTLGYEAAGIIDEVGPGVTGYGVGDRVFGASSYGAAQAELAVLTSWAPTPPTLDDASVAAIPVVAETAARALDKLGVTPGSTLVISGASGNVGSAAVQFALARGARVIGTGSPRSHDRLRALGCEPVSYGLGMPDRVRALAPTGVDFALDIAGSGILADLVALTGAPERVVTVADFVGAQRAGVHFSGGEDGRADYAVAQAAQLAARGRFSIRVGQTFPLAEVGQAHRIGEAGRVHGKLVLLADGAGWPPGKRSDGSPVPGE